MEPGSAARAPTVARAGPDLPCVLPQPSPGTSNYTSAVCRSPGGLGPGPEESKGLLSLQASAESPGAVRSRRAFLFHHGRLRNHCHTVSSPHRPSHVPQVQSETDLAQQETEGGVFSSTQYGIVSGVAQVTELWPI